MSKWADQSLPRKVGACSEDLLLWNNECLRTCVTFIAKPGGTGVGSHSLGTADSKVYEQAGWGSTVRHGHYFDHVATSIISVVKPLRVLEKICLLRKCCANTVVVPFIAFGCYLAATALQWTSVGVLTSRLQYMDSDKYISQDELVFGIASTALCGIAALLYLILTCVHCCQRRNHRDTDSEYKPINDGGAN